MNSSSRSLGVRCCSSQYSVIGDAVDQFHHEVGAPAFGGARVEHLGNVGMVHHRQRLPLGFEAGDHLPRVHARLDDLQRDAAFDRLLLLGHVDDAHAAFADLLQQLVGADLGAGLFGDGLVDGGSLGSTGWSFQETVRRCRVLRSSASPRRRRS